MGGCQGKAAPSRAKYLITTRKFSPFPDHLWAKLSGDVIHLLFLSCRYSPAAGGARTGRKNNPDRERADYQGKFYRVAATIVFSNFFLLLIPTDHQTWKWQLLTFGVVVIAVCSLPSFPKLRSIHAHAVRPSQIFRNFKAAYFKFLNNLIRL